MNMKQVLTLFFGLAFLVANGQEISNINLETTKDQLIVTYDLEGMADKVYDVNVKFKKADSSFIIPNTIHGDIGKVAVGTSKKIVWDVYKDVDGLSGSIEPVFDIKEMVSPRQQAPVHDQPSPQKPMVDIFNDVIKRKPRAKSLFGYKILLGSSRMVVENDKEFFDNEFSWGAGLFHRWNINRRMSLQTELGYHNHRYEETLSGDENSEHSLDYVRGQLVAGIAPFFGLTFNAGVYASSLLGGREHQELDTGKETIRLTEIDSENGEDCPYNYLDSGFLIGGSINLGGGKSAIGVHYTRSFNDVLNSAFHEGDERRGGNQFINRGIHFYIQRAF